MSGLPPYNAYRFETDLSLRIKRLGYRIIFDPKAIVYHRRAPKGGVRVNVYEWNYWFSRNHTIYLLTCLNRGALRAMFFVLREIIRVLSVSEHAHTHVQMHGIKYCLLN